VTHQMITNNMK